MHQRGAQAVRAAGRAVCHQRRGDRAPRDLHRRRAVVRVRQQPAQELRPPGQRVLHQQRGPAAWGHLVQRQPVVHLRQRSADQLRPQRRWLCGGQRLHPPREHLVRRHPALRLPQRRARGVRGHPPGRPPLPPHGRRHPAPGLGGHRRPALPVHQHAPDQLLRPVRGWPGGGDVHLRHLVQHHGGRQCPARRLHRPPELGGHARLHQPRGGAGAVRHGEGRLHQLQRQPQDGDPLQGPPELRQERPPAPPAGLVPRARR
mmetsp:Transcript_20355/g.51238  ORF Transcript_20355/g.51238 Transcript_20355/m.51238 type:complete len:259 (-) Transcript_20355:494-1270(-)